MTENEMCMVEQLCYINPDLIEAATGKGYTKKDLSEKIRNMEGSSVKEILDELGLNDEAIARLTDMGGKEIDGACASAEEWAGILKYLRNSDLSEMVLCGTMVSEDKKTTLAMCFTEGDDPSSAIVAFKGTSGAEEWADNIEGLNETDTECQKEALAYIESLPYEGITVIGHSKGGNKAMYVTIKSDKVAKCYSYDGQGFSQEFMDKYWAEIDMRGDKIKNYSVSTDYVHALLFPIPNSEQIYCQGYGVDNVAQNHSPNSFFVMDANGNLILDENGKPQIIRVEEDPSITMLHEFTTFILNNASDADKEAVINYLAPLIAEVFSGEADAGKLIDMVLEDPDTLALVVAYLVKYMEAYDLDAEEIDQLLEAIGLNSLNELVNLTTIDVGKYEIGVNLNLANILNYLKNQLTDGNDDFIISHLLLPALKKLLADDYDINAEELWSSINEKVKQIDTSGGTADARGRDAHVRDFSRHVYEVLMGSIERVERMQFSSVEGWKFYSDESWYHSLLVGTVVRGLTAYFNKLSEINQDSKVRIEKIFEDVHSIDDLFSASLGQRVRRLKGKCRQLQTMTETIT